MSVMITAIRVVTIITAVVVININYNTIRAFFFSSLCATSTVINKHHTFATNNVAQWAGLDLAAGTLEVKITFISFFFSPQNATLRDTWMGMKLFQWNHQYKQTWTWKKKIQRYKTLYIINLRVKSSKTPEEHYLKKKPEQIYINQMLGSFQQI